MLISRINLCPIAWEPQRNRDEQTLPASVLCLFKLAGNQVCRSKAAPRGWKSPLTISKAGDPFSYMPGTGSTMLYAVPDGVTFVSGTSPILRVAPTSFGV